MPEVPLATATPDLGADHEVRLVGVFGQGILRTRGRERGPTRPLLEFLSRLE